VTDPSAKIVSFEDEPLILVDAEDNETGILSKAACHDGDGVLHRAFSVFLFNDVGELLLQQRAAGKRLWPKYWSNSCCSHPRRGEELHEAASRRLQDELHTDSELEFVYRFVYQASFGELGAEHESCHVFLGRLTSEPQANDTEIAQLRYVSANELEREIDESPEMYTPWFKLEWQRLNEEYSETLRSYLHP
jgi:isopentenyl-diphosphate delta-isomerase